MSNEHDAERLSCVVYVGEGEGGSVDGDVSFRDERREECRCERVGGGGRKLEGEAEGVDVGSDGEDGGCCVDVSLCEWPKEVTLERRRERERDGGELWERETRGRTERGGEANVELNEPGRNVLRI